ncbi:MAG: SEC-C domain-containing protein, partial [Alphaproteobacteria bacterium]|nr:SEC-C domain-containing protein [Alphaproteobacteria bacterium]
QRKVVYEQRRDIMRQDDVSGQIQDMRRETLDVLIARCIPHNAYPEQWDTSALHEEILRLYGMDLPVADWAKEEGIAEEEIHERIADAIERKMASKTAETGPEIMRQVEKSLLLQELDHAWKEHLLTLDHLRQGINLRAYAQRDPLNEYKKEAFELFEAMLAELRERVTTLLARVQIRVDAPPASDLMPEDPEMGKLLAQHPLPEGMEMRDASSPTQAARKRGVDANDPSTWANVPRNAECPCGSGKKFKHCHGRS